MLKRTTKIVKYTQFKGQKAQESLVGETEICIDNQIYHIIPTQKQAFIDGLAWVNTNQTQPVADRTLTFQELYHLTAAFNQAALLYKDTSITQSSALVTQDLVLHGLGQDLSEEHCLTKTIGEWQQTQLPCPILLGSGKLSKYMVQLAITLGISIIIVRLAPTQAALDLAMQHDITIVGFARGTRCSVFSDKKKRLSL